MGRAGWQTRHGNSLINSVEAEAVGPKSGTILVQMMPGTDVRVLQAPMLAVGPLRGDRCPRSFLGEGVYGIALRSP